MREVVLCVSEIDAMAVYQETKVVALALPNGAVDLPQEVTRADIRPRVPTSFIFFRYCPI